MRRQSLQKALKTTVDEGRNVVRNELQHFLEGRDKTLYVAALKATAGGAGWSTVKQFIEAARKTPVSGPDSAERSKQPRGRISGRAC